MHMTTVYSKQGCHWTHTVTVSWSNCAI